MAISSDAELVAALETILNQSAGYEHANVVPVSLLTELKERLSQPLVRTGDRLTDQKANDIIDRDGYDITGVIMAQAGTGRRCLVELSCVRWLSAADAWTLMHGPTLEDRKSVEALIVETLAEQNDPKLWAALTHGSGPYEITSVNHNFLSFAIEFATRLEASKIEGR
jgi:hypothetical protein